LLDDLMGIQDKALLDQWAAEVKRLTAEHVPSPRRDNVVLLFGEVAVRSLRSHT
jgi:hypothetical protein